MTITDKAADKVKKILTGEGKENCGIRIYIAGTGCCGPSYGLNIQEEHMPDDVVIEKNGLKVFMDQETRESLTGREFDYYVGKEGEGFIFTGGVSACGTGGSGGSACGSSNSGCNSCG